MTNSPLVNFTLISPNSTNPRNRKISKITIHHMAGNLTVEQCGNVFQPKSRQASSNYGISTDGRVGLYVNEANRSWASSCPANDHMAVTIEVANDGGANWHVSDVALEKTIELCTDICKRNDIKKLNFTGDKTGNLTMHRYFAATACPGDYLASKFPYIADEVNRRLLSNELMVAGDIVQSLEKRGIITNPALWNIKCVSDINAYWLARKIANMTVNHKRHHELKTINDIVWELGFRGILTDSKLWLKILVADKDLYWLSFKACNLTQNK
ncbi:MAG: N-acetylmuramoyl-L-alanine amidase [Clostridia bacterium]|nr:N-acetylmuramoyl-L-alanine amidase [Clostridia bacterium]